MISDIVTQLKTTSFGTQVLRPDEAGVTTVNGGLVVAGLVTGAVGGRIYQVILPEREALPNATFQMLSSRRDEVDGLPIAKTETIHLILRDSTIAGLQTVAATVRSSLLGYQSAGNAGAIVIDDEAIDVEEVDDGQQFRLHMELTVSHLNTASQTLPVAFVYPIRTTAGDPNLNSHPRVMVEDELAVMIIEDSTSGALDTAISTASTALIGFHINGFPVDYAGGELVRMDSHLVTWRERFTLMSYRAV